MRITRHHMYKSIFDALPLPLNGSILGIDSLKYFRGSKNFSPDRKIIEDDADVKEVFYPEVSMLKLPFADNTFDAVISDQVLEHIEGDVFQAIEESRRVLKPGGLAIHTSICIQPIHWGPKDMWRFTPDGLRYLCRNFSEIVVCESWGNRWAHALFFLHDKARDWEVPERKISPVHWLASKNDPGYPLTVWIIAKK